MQVRTAFCCTVLGLTPIACSISDKIVVREDLIEQAIEPALVAGATVVQPMTRYDGASNLWNERPNVLYVDGVGSLVIAGFCPTTRKSEVEPCASGGSPVPVIGFCGLFRSDGSLQQYPCQDGRFGLAVRSGDGVFVMGSERQSYLVEPGQAPKLIRAAYSQLAPIDVKVFGGSLRPSSILRTHDTYQGSTSFASTGYRIERVTLSADGIGTVETLATVEGSATQYNRALWVEEQASGKVATLMHRSHDETSQLVYRVGDAEQGVEMPSKTVPEVVRRGSDGSLWMTTREQSSLLRWNPDQGGAAVVVDVPVSSLDAPWLVMQGFMNARAQSMIKESASTNFQVPTAYEAMYFTGSQVKKDTLALTPCRSREACREIGESYLLGVVGAGESSRALYAIWAWEVPRPTVNEPTHHAMGMYLTPVRPPTDPAVPGTDAGRDVEPESGAEASFDAPLDVAPDLPSCQADGANTFCDPRDGRIYRLATIQGQTWMAENLAFDSVGSHCYGDQLSNCEKYGRLYQWAATTGGAGSSASIPSGVRGVCPLGWHLPSKPEWGKLNTNVGPGSAGMQLKSALMGGSDDWGFGVLAAGYALDTGSGPQYAYEGTDANYWTATEVDANRAWHIFFTANSITMGEADSDTKRFHYSVRCVRD